MALTQRVPLAAPAAARAAASEFHRDSWRKETTLSIVTILIIIILVLLALYLFRRVF